MHMAPFFSVLLFLRSFGLEKMQGWESGRLCILVFPRRKGRQLREQSGGLRLQGLSWTLADNC